MIDGPTAVVLVTIIICCWALIDNYVNKKHEYRMEQLEYDRQIVDQNE